MINPRISAVWSTTKPRPPFSCTSRVQEVHTKAEVVHPRISAVWSTFKPISPFSYTPRVQEVHTKAEFLHLTPGFLGLDVLFNCHA